MFFDPAYGMGSYFPRRKKKKKVLIQPSDEMDFFQKYMMFNQWLEAQEERKKSKEPKKDDKKLDPKKGVDTTGLAAFLMVFSFFAGQASLLYLMANMPK